MKYELVTWPEIQDYMESPRYPTDVYFDPDKNAWFVPEDLEEEINSQRTWKNISWYLKDTNEALHMHVHIPVDFDENQGLSELDKLTINEIWQHPTEGIITFKLYGSNDEFDLSEYPQIWEEVLNYLSNEVHRYI